LSAAAAPLARRVFAPRAAAPIPAIAGGWVPIPRVLLERVGPSLSKVERAIVDLVLLRTLADDENGRPDSAIVTESEFADYAGATVDGVHRALVRLERALCIIESEPEGRRKRYRLALENADCVPAPRCRRIARKPPQPEAEVRMVEACAPAAAEPESPARAEIVEMPAPKIAADPPAPDEPIVIGPAGGEAEIAVPTEVRSITFRNDSPIAVAITSARSGSTLEIAMGEASRESALPPREDVEESRAFLLEFVPMLAAGPRECDVEALAAARAGRVSIAQLRAHTTRRIRAGLRITSYGIFPKLAADCVAAAEAWTAAHASSPAAVELPDFRGQLNEWAGQVEKAGPEFAAIADELRGLAEHGGHDFEALDARLVDLRESMIVIAREGAGAERIAEIRRDIEPWLKFYRPKMTREQIAALEEQAFGRRILDALELPLLHL
jgi:hypothetical protein